MKNLVVYVNRFDTYGGVSTGNLKSTLLINSPPTIIIDKGET